MMIEDEAKTKWCPFARAMMSKHHTTASNRASPLNMQGFDITRCIASSCMAWRWDTRDYDANGLKIDDLSGYCGLAGKP